MIRPATRIGLEIVAGIAGVVVVLVGLFAWRLSEGPVPVTFLASVVEDEINQRLEGYTVDVGDTVIAWTQEAGAVEFIAVDVRVRGEQDRTVAELPRMAMDFRVLPLLEGRAVPKRLVLEGAQLALVRRADGTMRFGLTGPGDAPDTDEAVQGPPAVQTPSTDEQRGDAVMAALLDAVSTPDPREAGIPRLEGLSIRKASFTVFDERSGGLWLAPNVQLEFRNTERGMAGVVRANVLSPGGEWELVGTVSALGAEGPVVLSADVKDLRLPDFSRTMEVLAPLAMVDAAVTGRLIARLSREGLRILSMSVDLAAAPGTVRLPVDEPAPFYPPPPLNYDGSIPETPEPPPYDPQPWTYEIDGARIVGNVTWPEGHVDLKEFTLEGERLKGTWTGQADAKLGPDSRIEHVDMTLAGADIAIDIPNVTLGIMRLDSAALALGLDTDDWRLDIDEVSVGLDEGRIWLGGTVTGIADGNVGVALDGGIEHIKHDDMMQIWPPRVGHGAREWVAGNVSGGEIVGGTVKIDAPEGELLETPLPNEAVDISLEYAGKTVTFMNGVSPVREARGDIHLQGNSFEARMVDGVIEPAAGGLIRLSNGTFTTKDFHIRGNDGFITADADGAMRTMLALLDEEPLGYTSSFGIDPAQVSGTARAHFDTRLPLRNKLRFADIGFGAKGKVQDLALPPIREGLTLDKGRLAFTVSNKGLTSDGRIALNGVPVDLRWRENFEAGNAPSSTYEVAMQLDEAARETFGVDLAPYLTGPVAVQAVLRGSGPELAGATISAELSEAALQEDILGWEKPAGAPARMSAELAFPNGTDGAMTVGSLAVGGEGVQISGSARFDAERDLISADLPIFMLGKGTDLSVRATRLEDGGLSVDLRGRSLDARGVISRTLGSDEDEPEDETKEDGPPLAITADIEHVIAHNGVNLRNAQGFFRQAEGRFQQFSLQAAFEDQGTLAVELRPTTYGTRTVVARAGDAGAVIRGADIYENITGGELAFEAEIDDRKDGSPLEGRLQGGGFRVRNAPVLASILTLGSLTGIRDTLDGDGIKFTRLDMPMSMTDHAFDLKDGIVSGPALGATIKGHVNRDTDEVDLGGTIVPAYSINTFLGKVPILGDLMTSREGEGVIGITYALSGPIESPTITVNPLAALLPGIFRRLFEMGGSASEDEVAETAEPPAESQGDAAPPGNGG